MLRTLLDSRLGRRGRAHHDDLQRLPLLRGPLRGVPGDDPAAGVLARRPRLPRQPLPQLRLLLPPLPVRRSPRVRSFARLRPQSYQAYAWPRALAPLFERNGLAIAWTAALSVAVFLIAFMSLADPGVMFGTVTGPGAFYAIMPHNAMVGLFGSVFVYSLVALAMGLRAFWRDAPPGDAPEADSASIRQAMKDAGSLRYLDGGGAGCMNEDEQPETRRRLYHHLTFYGFALCFAATCVATVYHYLFGWQAPYGPLSMPVILGTLGGFGIVIGPAGLYAARRRQDRELRDPAAAARGMDVAFLAMLCLTGLTGLLLLVLRATPAMGTLLAVHLGFVFAFFLAMPYGKFVHGLYRYAALVRYAMERRGNT
jgi:citrate/tricarballylate utilization protein